MPGRPLGECGPPSGLHFAGADARPRRAPSHARSRPALAEAAGPTQDLRLRFSGRPQASTGLGLGLGGSRRRARRASRGRQSLGGPNELPQTAAAYQGVFEPGRRRASCQGACKREARLTGRARGTAGARGPSDCSPRGARGHRDLRPTVGSAGRRRGWRGPSRSDDSRTDNCCEGRLLGVFELERSQASCRSACETRSSC